ncbi:fibulin-1 [Drosophila elegans]|uniref:fibulin-1 n=1 Tax=Drosophila elegans TaxID=30023 RepID=UPI0007E67763|nr:fibulin-1 [Drosophila elegans]
MHTTFVIFSLIARPAYLLLLLFFGRTMFFKLCGIMCLLIVGHHVAATSASDDISDYIRKCCIHGLRHARTTASCTNINMASTIIPQLWIGLCHSTLDVCCSRELDHQNCVLGRLAALEGTRCDRGENLTSNSYATCCRSCQIGLAVKASNVNCKDPLFSFLSSIESYQACCYEAADSNLKPDKDTSNENSITEDGESLFDSGEDINGTIVLTGDDDICGKIENLCAHICENTFDAYQCKCRPGFTLDYNNVTCSPMNIPICPSGYILDKLENKCIDIDECRENVHECKLSQYCHNTNGGYHCLNVKAKDCPLGYHYDSEYDKCKDTLLSDDSECKDDSSKCFTEKSQSCESGFSLKNGSCTDIDECNNNTTNNCLSDNHQECINTLGSYLCQCQTGFNLDATLKKCVDINECSINNHNCLPTQRCDNTIGSYICTRLQSCGTGYTLNAETGNCDDDDECILNTHNCPLNYDCHNTKGSFRCYRKTTTSSTTTTTSTTVPPVTIESAPRENISRYPMTIHQDFPRYVSSAISRLDCNSGFYRNSLGACVDINECVERNPCGNHQRCINTNGHFRCESLLQCSPGYKSRADGRSCIDIDECETGEHNCGERQICRNRSGGYVCTCPIGHEIKRLSTGVNTCVDTNECELDQRVCPSNAHCFNTIGSYYCECKAGFKKKADNNNNTQCFDIDECQVVPGLCQQKCVNTWGGYRCTCNAGYQLGPDNRTCNDINECEVHKDYKLCMGFCINTPGSYQCSCPRGYTLSADMNSCRDIDECATDSINQVCTGRNDICTNTRGSYKCTTINCPYGYTIDAEQKNRCRQNTNFCEGEDCFTQPSAYIYNFITFVSKLMISPEGRTIFTLRGPLWYDNIDFDLKIVRIQATNNVKKATDKNFDTIKNNNQVSVLLKKSLEGPQDVELELSMTVYTNGMPRGKSVAKLFLFVSQHTF